MRDTAVRGGHSGGRWVAAALAACVWLAASDAEGSGRRERRPDNTHGRGERLTVHEWGTFTSLQDERGRAIPGINTDDEPLPQFVHRLSDRLIVDPTELAPVFYKGAPRVHQHVTMRLETPVIYFYPPAGREEPIRANVRVRFRGGWLTEYYPQACVDAPGLGENRFRFGPITPRTVGALEWNGLTIGGDPKLPETDSHVWLAPREVEAAPVVTPEGEGEQYLFYRGVGQLDAPLTVTRDERRGELRIAEHFDPAHFGSAESSRPATTLWLVHVREDGAVAYRALGRKPLTLEEGHVVATTDAEFPREGFSRENLGRLRGEMREALIEDGLYADEADALLSTWELGYFKSAGLRLFFLLPQQWTDAVLPLEVSAPSEITRTMVGRVEIVTPEHRKLMSRLESGRVTPLTWFYEGVEKSADRNAAMQGLWEGKARLRDTAISVPEDYQTYLDLGRFRNALILDELSRRPSGGLAEFARQYHISYFTPDE